MASAALGTAFRHLRHLFDAGSTLGLEDGQLLARYSRTNDPAAFEALVGRHGPMVLATCRAVLRNEHDVEDAFQATFLVLAKKAGSIQGAETLGGWLHRVAYRASVQASVQARKRRRKEAEASAMAPADATRPAREVEPDLRPILHEEIDRLPEGYRLPVVLCDLEGLSYEQAADRLRWTVPSLRCRLARARQRLKGRLTRRGVNPLAIGPILVPGPVHAIVPPALLPATVLAATGGPASAGVALLTHTLLRGMLMTKLKIAGTAALASLALATAGVIALGAGRPQGLTPAMKPPVWRAVVAKEAPAGKKPMQMVEIKGRVVDPSGKPVAGATIRGVYLLRDAVPWPLATSGSDGRFAILMPDPGGGDRGGFSRAYPWLVAVGPGHGVGWTQRALRADRPEVQEVRLVEEGPPIEGRIIDLEGRPVAGARVEAAQIWFDEKGDLPGWIARARNGAVGNLWQGLESLSLDPVSLPAFYSPRVRLAPIATSTGPDGRFKLTGVGRDRVAELIITGSGVATTQLYVLSRAEAEILTVDRGMMKPEPFLVHAPKFEIALAPSKRVEGTVRDKDSGKPIAGIEIHAALSENGGKPWNAGIDTWTDAEGRYRIDGLPLADAYRLYTKAENGLPYLNGSFEVPAASPGLGTVAFDFTLKRGVFIRGRGTDKVTGRPIRGYANYHAFVDNPLIREYPGFSQSYAHYAYFDEDGRYELVALPGRGLVAVRDEDDRYLPDPAIEKIKGYDAKAKGLMVVPDYVTRSNAIVAEVNVPPGSEGITLDLRADPGKSVAVEVVGPDGAPLVGTKVKGLKELFQTVLMPQESPGFEVRALEPGKPRRVVVLHEGLKLAGSAFLKGDEAGPVTIRLQPWGSVTGRIVDDEGKPRKGMFLSIPGQGPKAEHPETHDILPGSDWHDGVRVDDDGRFRVEGLVPGLLYDTTARSNVESRRDLFKNVTVAPGEVKDLGDLKVRPAKP